MSFNTALSSPQLTQLRRMRWQGDQLVSFCDNVIAFHSTVSSNLNSTPGTTTAVVPYGAVISGAYTNVSEGMVVIISPSSDMRNPLAIRLHVRYLNADATNVYTSEFSDVVGSGYHIWVLYAYDIIDNLSRPVSSGGVITQYQQYNQTFQRMAPVICGLQNGYANWVNGSGNYDIAFDVSTSFAPESGATISSYAYSVTPTGSGTATVIAGSAATAIVTYRFTYGEYWLKVVVTDSNGVSSFRHVLIKAHDRTNYLPAVNIEGAEIQRDIQQGPSARIKAFGSVDNLLNGTMCIIWVDEQYSDPTFTNVAGSLINNIDLVGWIETDQNQYVTDPKYSGYAECSFEVQGVGARLTRLEGQMLDISYASSPTLWDQVNNLTPWRAIIHFLQRHSTALQLCDFALANMSADNTFLFPTIVTNAGRALDNVSGEQGIAYEINAQVEFASDGRIQLARLEPYVATNLGHSPLIIGTWDNRDHCGIQSWKFSHYDQYGLSDSDGAAWSGTVNVPVMPVRNRAPGLAQGSGPDQGKLNNQILATTNSQLVAQAELAQRNGTRLAMLNNTVEITLAHPSQFHWLQPSFAQVYVLSFDTTSNIRGLALDAGTNWMIKQVTVRHDNKTGAREVSATYIPVRTGTPGTNIPIINQNEIAPSLPTIPPIPAFNFELPLVPEVGWTSAQVDPSLLLPPTGSIAKTDGNSLFVATATQAFWLTSFIDLTTPKYHEVTPADLGSYQIKAVAISPFLTNIAVPAYILASDGTNSAVWRTTNVAAGVVTWTKGADQTGVFSILRATNVNGGLLIYSANSSGTTTTTYDFTVNDGGFVPYVDSGNSLAVYSAGQGWTTVDQIVPAGIGSAFRLARIKKTFASTTVDQITAIYDLSGTTVFGSGSGGDPGSQLAVNNFGTTYVTSSWPQSNGTGLNMTGNGSTAATEVDIDVKVSIDLATNPGYPRYAGAATIRKVILTTGAPAGNSQVVYSSNHGATFGGALTVGTTPGAVGGFDVQSAGANSFAAASGAIYRATTLGGAYSSYYTITGGVNAACVIVPWKTWGGASNTTATNPDIIVGFTGPDGSSRSLVWIEGGVTPSTVHDISPVASSAFINPNSVTVRYNSEIACFVNVSGTLKLYKTTNVTAGGGPTWTLVKTLSNPQWIRCRRQDTRANPDGQCYLADNNVWYSSHWLSSGPFIRNMPSTAIVAADTVY